MLSFARLWPLWLLASIALIALVARSRVFRLEKPHAALMSVLRALILVLLSTALAQPALEVVSREVAVVYMLDLSRSVAPSFIDEAVRWIRAAVARGHAAEVGYVVFGGRALRVDSIDALASAAAAVEQAGAIDSSQTDLEEALDAARSAFGRGSVRRVVLLSDGNQTRGDVWRAAARLRAERVRVFAVPAPVSDWPEAWLEGCDAPESARVLEPVAIGVRVFSREPVRARVEVRIGRDPPRSRRVSLLAGNNLVTFTLRFRQAGAGLIKVGLELDGKTASAGGEWMQSVWVRSAPRVLYVEGAPASARYLRSALRTHGIDVTATDAAGLARDPGMLERLDAVILSDMSAPSLPAAVVDRLEAFVREGGGLIFAAGDAVHGKDGYAGSPLERLLPVKLEDRREREQLDLVVVMDRSASMQGRKLEFAKSAALSALELLAPHHRFAVVAFDSQPHEVVPLATARDRRSAGLAVGRLAAGGQTDIFNALQHAREMLEGSRAQTKHIILLSDGDTRPVARERTGAIGGTAPSTARPHAARDFPEMTALLARAYVTLSTVAIGERPELDFLRSLAQRTGGRSYVAVSEVDIPALLVRDMQRLLGESIVEQPFRPKRRVATAVLVGIDFARGPPLRGFAIARAKPAAEVLLEATQRRPLLVQSHYGLGRTVAFLSDAKDRWAHAWLDWPGYARFWTQIVRAAARPDAAAGLALRVERAGSDAKITLTAQTADGRDRNGLAVRLRAFDPQGRVSTQPLAQTAPGEYVAVTPLAPSNLAPYRFEIVGAPGRFRRELGELGSRSIFYAGNDELHARSPNLGLLRALSTSTGGRFVASADEVFADYGDRGLRRVELWPYLAATALALFMAEVLVRRALIRSGRASPGSAQPDAGTDSLARTGPVRHTIAL